MFGPYRTRPVAQHRIAERPQEEVVLGWALVVGGALRIALAVANHEVWGVEATLAGILVPAGMRLILTR